MTEAWSFDPLNPNAVDKNGWTALHHLAKAEAEKKLPPKDIERITKELLIAGADIHLEANLLPGQTIGDTAFNIAAPASPIIGRLMTNHWLEQALAGKGSKGLNDRSGSHGSSLAQYIAKWSNDDEIGKQLDDGMAKGMNIAMPNKSGWTPLHAAAAMIGRLGAVKALIARYTDEERCLRTTEDYQTKYNESAETIKYLAGLVAREITEARYDQAITLPETMKDELVNYMIAFTLRLTKATPNARSK